MALRLYNSLTRTIEEFSPQTPGKATLYTCGPTVYNYPHIGNYRAYIFSDILKRTLAYNGYEVQHVMNITDIDDKTIRDSQKAGQSLLAFTEFYTQGFFADRDMLHIVPAAKYTKATDYIAEMAAMILSLVAKGFAYAEPDGSVYFDIKKFPAYGKLAHIDLSELKDNASGRIKKDEYDKENAQDFALWKAWDEADGDVFWEPAGLAKGRPGWHIECSAMSIATLGETIDIHTGGIDNMFPHHENEIAQSECATGKPFVHYWMHCAHLMVDDKKMAKSAGNFYTLRDLEAQGFDPIFLRYLTFSAHYRSPLNFTFESLTASKQALLNLQTYFQMLGDIAHAPSDISTKHKDAFLEAINSDLNTAQALAVISDVRKDDSLSNAAKKATLLDFDRVLGLGLDKLSGELPEDVKEIAARRNEARQNKDWKLSDELRAKLETLGFEVYDGAAGTTVLPKN